MPNDNSNLRRLTFSPPSDPAQELQASEERFRELIENVHDVVWSIRFAADPMRAPATFVSAQSQEILGHSPGAFIADSNLWSSAIHPDDLPSVAEATKRLVVGGPAVTRIYRFQHGRTGEYRWLEDRLAPRRNMNGELIGLFGVARDITDRRRAEVRERHRHDILEMIAKGRPLQELLERIVSMVEDESTGALCSVLLLDKTGLHLRHGAAPRLPEFYNRAVDGLAIGPGVGSCGTCAYTGERVIVEDIQTHPYWEPFRDLAARAHVRSCWSEPIRSSAGQILGTFAIYHERPQVPNDRELEVIAIAANKASIAIERLRAEESLRESEERFRVIFEQAGVGVGLLDVETRRFVRINDRFCRILGLSAEEIYSSDFVSLTHPDDRAASAAAFERLLKGEYREYAIEKRYVRPDGGFRWVHLNVSPMWAEGATPTMNIAVVEDITDRKRAEEDRRRLEAQLQHAQKLESLGVMAGGIAHDFNNLLTGILGYCDLAQMELPKNCTARDHLAEAVSGARQAAELTKQMLAYSGKGKFVVGPIVLSDLVEDMARLLQISISKKCVLKFNFLPDLPVIEADSAQLRQIIMNLVINASEAIGDRSGLIAVSTGVLHCDRAYLNHTLDDQSLPEGLYAYLEVADSGCGMSEETRAKIFDPFFTTKFTGRGLGLSAVLGIVRGHRGTIKCYSEPGKGTTFKALFPVSDRPSAAPVTGPPTTQAWRGSGTVLVVDDEESILGMARHMLQAMGFKVLTAPDGRAGVDLYRDSTEPIRLVLLDMTMPRLDGEETFRELRRLRPDVRAILTSGYSELATTDRFAGKGLAGFLQKPYRFDELQTAVRKALETEK